MKLQKDIEIVYSDFVMNNTEKQVVIKYLTKIVTKKDWNGNRVHIPILINRGRFTEFIARALISLETGQTRIAHRYRPDMGTQ